jgi:hypothetical protein
MIYACCDDRRRAVLAAQNVFNGIDFLDVVDDPSMPNNQRQRTLRIHFLNPLGPGQLTAANIAISGGERIRDVKPVQVYRDVDQSPAGDPKVLVVVVNGPGDFTPYTLSIVNPAKPSEPPAGFDRILSTVNFSFKVSCPSTLDCQNPASCPAPPPAPVAISYLAKDFDSFRTLMFDRLATILPAWQETHPADLGVMLVEWIAFLGDYLSYQQDAVATEAYLGTARLRKSIRRHVTLVDYAINDGRNARTWVHFEAAPSVSGAVIGAGTQILTAGSDPSLVLRIGSTNYNVAIAEGPQVFELMENVTLWEHQNQMPFYTWGDRECCLPQGATTAYLRGNYPNLKSGMVLAFVEVKGPQTGAAGDADPAHRCAVRLSAVSYLSDPIGREFDEPPLSGAVDVTRIDWMPDDALPFALCLSSRPGNSYIDGVSIALGNIALADHGRTISGEELPSVPGPNPALTIAQPSSSDRCAHPAPVTPKPARYMPGLASAPLTFADPYQPSLSATAALQSRANEGLLPQVTKLTEQPSGDVWKVQRNLLSSDAANRNFVAEVENDGSATLRFGDGTYAKAPIAGTSFVAQYRVGNSTDGNIGANTLVRIATSDPSLLGSNPPFLSVTNPLPGTGGQAPETMDQVRQRAPVAFRTQLRAVTEEDYGTKALVVDPTLSKALGTFRWTGSWQTVFISVDPQGTEIVDDTRRQTIQSGMELYRMAGHDTDVIAPVYVSIELHLKVCVAPGYQPGQVEQALRNVLSNGTLPDGTKGLFHPDHFTFGKTVYLSPIYAAVQNTPGVASVTITRFQRQGLCSTNAVSTGKLPMDRLEIARLDNDPNYPEHGIYKLCMKGGQ